MDNPGPRHHKLKGILLSIFILAILVGAAWLFLRAGHSEKIIGDIENGITDADKIYYSRLTGRELSDQTLANRPATCIMIENSPDARPQSGLSDAGIVIEALAEGGISRFMAIFQEAKPNFIGPVRSVRLTYVEVAKAYHCSIAHVGGSTNALNLIRNNSAFRDIDQFFNDAYYWRASHRYAPHNVYTSFEKLDQLNQSRGYKTSDFKGFARVKPDSAPEKPAKLVKKITINMGSSDLYNPVYNYDAESNRYLRSHAYGGAHYSVDKNGKQTRNAPDVVIAAAVKTVSRAGTPYVDYTTTGSGEVTIFQNGDAVKGKWHRANNDAEFSFTDSTGKEILLNRGQVWISLYPENGKVKWK